LGGRYKIVGGLEPVPTGDGDCKRMKLTVTDILGDGKTEKSIILTQAGLAFRENKLSAADIARADKMMEDHRSANSDIHVPGNKDPIVMSYTGIGRNATLIAYRQVYARLGEVRNKEQLDALLKQVVIEGRKGRGPGFIHSAAQLEELRSAVLAAYNDLGEGAKANQKGCPDLSSAKPAPAPAAPAPAAAAADAGQGSAGFAAESANKSQHPVSGFEKTSSPGTGNMGGFRTQVGVGPGSSQTEESAARKQEYDKEAARKREDELAALVLQKMEAMNLQNAQEDEVNADRQNARGPANNNAGG
jgi:hypothetical protein